MVRTARNALVPAAGPDTVAVTVFGSPGIVGTMMILGAVPIGGTAPVSAVEPGTLTVVVPRFRLVVVSIQVPEMVLVWGIVLVPVAQDLRRK